MSTINDGGPAFPRQVVKSDDGTFLVAESFVDVGGMSLRDYFAAKALQGLLSQFQGVANGVNPMHHATWSYEMADAMLKAREAAK